MYSMCQQSIWPASSSSSNSCSLCTSALQHLVSQNMQLHFQHDWFQSLPLEICSSCFIPFWVTFVQIKGEGHRQNYKNWKQWESLPTEDKDRLCQDSQDRKFNYSSEPFSYNLLIWSKIRSSTLIPNYNSMWHKMLSEHPVSLWRLPQSSVRPSKLWRWPWQASPYKRDQSYRKKIFNIKFSLKKELVQLVVRRGKHIFNMSHRFHRGMVEQYKGHKVVAEKVREWRRFRWQAPCISSNNIYSILKRILIWLENRKS